MVLGRLIVHLMKLTRGQGFRFLNPSFQKKHFRILANALYAYPV